MGKEFYFETDDRLDRKKYAEFLKTLLEHCDEYRREDSDGAYVIAIDSPWGTGKTRFAKMLRNYLEDRTKEMGDDSAPGDNASFNAIYYNSWETDFSTDALQPLIHSITRSPEFMPDEFDTAGKEILDKFKKSAVAVAKVAGYALIHHFLGETVTQMAKAIDEVTSEKAPDPLEEYQSRLDLLKGFKTTFQEVIKQTRQKKLVIIIDELDRCRPTFAIETLEIVKHLFDISGLMFVFALDIDQLSCSIRTVYGNNMDSSGYLCRFFEYISRLPLPDKASFIRNAFDNRPISVAMTNNDEILFAFIESIVESFSLSLRDISTILQTYFIIDSVFLYKYDYLEAKMLYFALLTIKYIDPHEYSNYLCGNSNNKYVRKIERLNIEQKRKDILIQQLNGLKMNKKIKNSYMKLIALNGSASESETLQLMSTSKEMIRGKQTLSATYRFESNPLIRKEALNNTDSWGYLLFTPDFENLVDIQNYTFSEYYFRQLEMFNFALPSEGSES